jgi:hypothetical protein
VLCEALFDGCACAEDFTYLVFFIAYQYYFSLLKLYALFTLHVTAWGTREGVAGGIKLERPDMITEEFMAERRIQVRSSSCRSSPVLLSVKCILLCKYTGYLFMVLSGA